jgi:hypothetical protein
VASAKTTLVDSIDESLQKVTDLFAYQCEHGAQTKSLPSEFAACGQFIGVGAGIAQRGLHGIAAALRVLGPSQTDEARRIVPKLVKYCEVCFRLCQSSAISPDQLINHTDNVLKLGELLYGLSFVSASQADTGRLTRHIAGELQASLIDGRSWGYFLQDTEPQLLPTAYAIRGLAQNGFDVSTSQKFVTDTLRGRSDPSKQSPADLTTALACAYCLTFVTNNVFDRTTAMETFDSAWRSLDSLLGEDVEQNLEYWSAKAKETHYVRVPWQLYLLALAAEYRFFRFATFRGQRRLKAVIKELKSGAFKYPYSGRNLSSRTNAIAYDALSEIRKRVRWRGAMWLAYHIDRLRVRLGSPTVRFSAVILGLIIAGYSTWLWSIHGGDLAELAPHFIAAFIILLLSLARR